MPTVRASCPTCGDVDMTTADVQVQRFAPGEVTAYAFSCPRCRVLVTKPASGRVVDMLMAAGARMVTWTRPAELDEIHQGPAVGYDDLLAFHFEVESEGWLDALLGSTPGGR